MATTFVMTNSMRRGTSILRTVLGLGLPMGPLYLLSVKGRRSGTVYITPVAVVTRGGRRWLVAAFGVTGWVRNLRAAGEAELGRGGRMERIRVEELGAKEAAPVLKEFLRQFGIVPFFRPYWSVGAGAEIGAFEGVAAEHPVFEIGRNG